MTGQQLRNSILQEAIQGRLVPNVLEPGEKTGAELLRQILKERQDREDKEKGKKAKKLTLSTIEEKPWELPEGWCWCKLGDTISLLSGRDLEPDKYNANQRGVPYITGASNFDRGTVIINRWTLNPVSISKKGDLLITCKGTVGELAFNIVGDVHIARQIMAISPIIVDANYIRVFLKAKVNDLNAQANGVIPGISREDILFADFPLPPLSIQKAIVAKIEELLPIVDEYDKAAVELETLNKILPDKLRKSVLQEAIHGTLVPNDIPEGEATGAELLQQILNERQEKENKEKGKKAKKLSLSVVDEELWELPEGWKWCALRDVCSDFIVPQRDKPTVFDGDIPWCRIEDVEGKYLNGSKSNQCVSLDVIHKMNMRICPVGTVISACSASIGNQAIIKKACCTNQTFIGLVNIQSALLSDYLYYFLMASKERLKELGAGTTIMYISKNKYEALAFPLPPLSIQHRIVEKIEEVFAAIDNLPA